MWQAFDEGCVACALSCLVLTCACAYGAAGAGDCFMAAYMVGVLQGRSTAEAMKVAAAAASICVSRPGAMTSLPTRQELDQFLTTMKLWEYL